MSGSPITDAERKIARENSIKQLCDLYRVVIAIAVGIAAHAMVSKYASSALLAEHILMLVIFLLLIIPFFHGAVRHLFATYVEGGIDQNIKNWAVLVDYYLLFLEGGVFVAIASLFDWIPTFFWMVLAVLVLDTVWGVFAIIGFAGSRSQKAEKKWAAINFVTSAVLIAFYILHSCLGLSSLHFIGLMSVIVSVRTVVDYWLNLDFYCP